MMYLIRIAKIYLVIKLLQFTIPLLFFIYFFQEFAIRMLQHIFGLA